MSELRQALRRGLAHGAAGAPIQLLGSHGAVAFGDLATKTGLGPARAALEGRSVLVRTSTQLAAAQALVELDGLARRMVLCPPDLDAAHLPTILEQAQIDAVVTDDEALADVGAPAYQLGALSQPLDEPPGRQRVTEWLMFTSGTTGGPKMVIHSLAGLTGAIAPPSPGAPLVVWGTFYDIRRYGGLQILLRALIGGASLVLSDPHQPTAAFIARLAAAGVTHLTGTPSHWRWALMNPELAQISPRYVRLSGEIADQAVLDSLRAFFPNAAMGHAYASTEAGVGFEVTDGLEGFPAALLDAAGPVEMKVEDGSLRIRSPRAASGYAGHDAALVGPDGFVDTGDLVELRGDRYYFAGRRGGVINIGGLKVHPEEIEAVLNRHPMVRMALVRSRRNPITGALVVAEIIRTEEGLGADEPTLKASILDACREVLAPHKVPASLKFVDSLAVTPGGKLDRQHA